jgi:hypothetical protein
MVPTRQISPAENAERECGGELFREKFHVYFLFPGHELPPTQKQDSLKGRLWRRVDESREHVDIVLSCLRSYGL